MQQVTHNPFIHRYNDLSFYLIGLMLLSFVYVWVSHHKEMRSLFKNVFQLKLSEQVFRNREGMSTMVHFILMANFVLALTMIFFKAKENLNFFNEMPINHWEWLVAVCVILIGRKVFEWIIAELFSFGQKVRFYHFTFSNLNKIFGIFCIPCLLLMYYGNDQLMHLSIYLLFALYIILVLIRVFNFLIIGKGLFRLYKFYFFLYFCTSELLPNLLLIKLIL